MVIWIIVFVIVSGGILYAIGLYNKLVRNKNMVAEGWSGIDVQLHGQSKRPRTGNCSTPWGSSV